MRAADLIALRRCGGSAVLAFKERVDELSRLSAGRAEDEALLQQLSEKLPALTHDAASRLTEECRLRDEWRQERCKQALGALPGAGDDTANVDRMREYVALLAPQGGTAAQLPWQLCSCAALGGEKRHVLTHSVDVGGIVASTGQRAEGLLAALLSPLVAQAAFLRQARGRVMSQRWQLLRKLLQQCLVLSAAGRQPRQLVHALLERQHGATAAAPQGDQVRRPH